MATLILLGVPPLGSVARLPYGLPNARLSCQTW